MPSYRSETLAACCALRLHRPLSLTRVFCICCLLVCHLSTDNSGNILFFPARLFLRLVRHHSLPTLIRKRLEMASNSEAADIPELTKLARDLYLTCNSISGDAPDGFNQLVASLASLHSVFQTLRDDASTRKFELAESDDECRHTLYRCLHSCSGTLQQLKEVVDMYRNTGFENGRQLWQSIDWMTQQAFIDDLKSKIVAHTCYLGVCVGSLTK